MNPAHPRRRFGFDVRVGDNRDGTHVTSTIRPRGGRPAISGTEQWRRSAPDRLERPGCSVLQREPSRTGCPSIRFRRSLNGLALKLYR